MSSKWKVEWSYLPKQFARADEILDALRQFVPSGDFTLGKPVAEFEKRFAALIGRKHGIGVNSGTDAIKLSLRALGVWHGDDVITTANTFIATVGAIAELGARPVLVDCADDFCMDLSQVEAAITPRTKAIVPVHLAGQMTDMPKLLPLPSATSSALSRIPANASWVRSRARSLAHSAMPAHSLCIP